MFLPPLENAGARTDRFETAEREGSDFHTRTRHHPDTGQRACTTRHTGFPDSRIKTALEVLLSRRIPAGFHSKTIWRPLAYRHARGRTPTLGGDACTGLPDGWHRTLPCGGMPQPV